MLLMLLFYDTVFNVL